MNLGCDLFTVIVCQLTENGCCNLWQQLESCRLGPFLYCVKWISDLMGGSSCRRLALARLAFYTVPWPECFFSNAPSSFATGIVLQRFAIIDQRRLTRGGQSLLMWRQWFCFFRMFGIVFLPAQSGRCCHGDSGSSWLRSCWPSERRQMENRHWTANPSLLISNSHRKAQEIQKQTPDIHQTHHTSVFMQTHTTQADYCSTNPHLGIFCLLLHLFPSSLFQSLPSSAHPPSLTSSRHIQWKQWD